MSSVKKKKKPEEAELDITPMIDVTFLLLIFFMVTSTMQATPDKDIPGAKRGDNANMAGFLQIGVAAPKSSTVTGEITLDNKSITLEALKERLLEESRRGTLKIMVFGERNVSNEDVGEIESILGEIKSEIDGEMEVSFAVQDQK